MAKIRKRTLPSGAVSWLVDHKDTNGKRRAKQFSKKKDAEAWMAQTLVQVNAGTYTPESAKTTVAQAGGIWLSKCEVEGLEYSTIRQYRQHLDLHIVPFIGNVRLSRLTRPGIENFVDDLLMDGRSKAMAKRVVTSLKAIFKEAQRRGLVAQNPASDVSVKIPNREAKEIQIPTKDELRAILEASDGRWQPLFLTLAFTGMRISEARGLLWCHVSFEERLLSIKQRADNFGKIGPPKSKAGNRDIPLTPIVLNTLRHLRLQSASGDEGMVFPNGRGRVESLSNIYSRGWMPAVRRAGIMGSLGLHSLRHFFASHLIDQDFQPKRVQQLMGHSSIVVTMDTYAKLWAMKSEDLEKMAKAELSILGQCNISATHSSK